MADLNVALILRLVDKATAPARTALRQIERSGAAMRNYGAQQVALSRTQIANAQARTGALAGEAVALAGTGYAMVKALGPAIEFEAAMAKVGAVSRANDDDLAKLTDTARMLGRETPWSASQAAEGMQYLAMAGFDVNEVVAAMPGMLALASAGATDLGSTADIASNILTGFGMKADEMGRVGDVLVNTFTSSNTTVGMLGETMKYVAPAAASLGVDLETAAAMAGKLGDAGIQGSEAGTALRGILTRLAAPSKDAADTLKELGVSVSDANGNMRAVPEILADIDEAMRGYGGAARAEMIKTLFETEAMSAATILLGQAGSGSLQSYAESLKETGSAARVAAQINDNTAGALKTLQSRAESLSIALGTQLLPMVVDLTDALIPLFDKLTAWGEANPELVRGAALLAVSFLGLRVALLAGRFVIQTAVMAFWALNGALGALIWVAGVVLSTIERLIRVFIWLSRVAIWLVRGALVLLRGAIVGVARALIWAGRAAMANPLWLALTGIALAAWAIYENWDGFVSYFTDKIDRVRAAFDEGLLNGVLALMAELNPFAMMLDGAIALTEFMLDKLQAAFDLDLFDKGVAMIKSLGDGIWSVLTDLVNSIKETLNSITPDFVLDGLNWVKGDDGATGGGASGSWEPTGARALGGPVRAGGIYRWMEEGQEFFSPTVDGSVISTRQLRSLKSGTGARSSTVTIGDINVYAAPGQSATEIARAVRREIERTLNTGGALHDGGAYAD